MNLYFSRIFFKSIDTHAHAHRKTKPTLIFLKKKINNLIKSVFDSECTKCF